MEPGGCWWPKTTSCWPDRGGDCATPGLAVDVAHGGSAALTQAGLTAYDVIVLDRDLPVMHGDRVCRKLAGAAPGS